MLIYHRVVVINFLNRISHPGVVIRKLAVSILLRLKRPEPI